MRAENHASRLAPMPSNAEPVSRAARIVMNRAEPEERGKENDVPVEGDERGGPPAQGRIAIAATTAASPRVGPARKTQLVVRL